MKKIIAFTISLILILFSGTKILYADDTVYTEGAFNYLIDDEGSITITYYFGDQQVVEIPRNIGIYEKDGEYFPHIVTKISADIFKDVNVEKVILPDSVIYIEKGAFKDGIDIQYYNSEGQAIGEKDEPKPVISEPEIKEEKEVINGSEDDGIEFEEIEIGIDDITNEQVEIWDIEDDDLSIDNDNSIEENKDDLVVNDDETTEDKLSQLSNSDNNNYIYVVSSGVVIVAAGYYYYKKKKNK